MYGDMRHLPFENESFDLVMCISSIEHLHQQIFDERQIKNYNTFIRDSKRSVEELGRVVKNGGIIYITSDLYDPNLQKTDRWWKSLQDDVVVGAYKFEDFSSTFIDSLRKQGFVFSGKDLDLDFSLVINGENRSNFRGRYITTFYLLMSRCRN